MAEPINERFEKIGTHEIYRVLCNLINALLSSHPANQRNVGRPERGGKTPAGKPLVYTCSPGRQETLRLFFVLRERSAGRAAHSRAVYGIKSNGIGIDLPPPPLSKWSILKVVEQLFGA